MSMHTRYKTLTKIPYSNAISGGKDRAVVWFIVVNMRFHKIFAHNTTIQYHTNRTFPS